MRQELGFRGPQNYCLPESINRPKGWFHFLGKKEAKKEVQQYYNHISSREIVSLVGEKIWNSYYKFTVERNPFDKVVSMFYFLRAQTKYDSILDFIQDGGLEKLQSYDLYSISKLPVMDTIYRYEDLTFFEVDLTRKLNLEKPFTLVDYKAKSDTRLIRDYHKVLDKKSVELIEIAFAREIKMLGYEF